MIPAPERVGDEFTSKKHRPIDVETEGEKERGRRALDDAKLARDVRALGTVGDEFLERARVRARARARCVCRGSSRAGAGGARDAR